ncbi:MAG: TetR/AcrR family transcriptional regulator [Hahellaceae bacterium]|nr:TetR/AcrR family transcriptional regulator [Hahellaceae bacterium]MCP5169941.1 TetR/AcrR family transcriptional regulator [Hahellaceae bacterium]
MSKRAESSAQTALDIFEATKQLWHERPIAEITLEAIAERVNVSVRTIIRRYGSKEGLFEACIQNSAVGVEANRDKASVGDVEGAIRCLLTDYEAHGDAMIRTLAVEDQLDIARRVLVAGRIYHQQWCEHMFSPYLPDKESELYTQELMAFVAATELYLWKLLRRDLHQDLHTTQRTFVRLVNGIINGKPE